MKDIKKADLRDVLALVKQKLSSDVPGPLGRAVQPPGNRAASVARPSRLAVVAAIGTMPLVAHCGDDGSSGDPLEPGSASGASGEVQPVVGTGGSSPGAPAITGGPAVTGMAGATASGGPDVSGGTDAGGGATSDPTGGDANSQAIGAAGAVSGSMGGSEGFPGGSGGEATVASGGTAPTGGSGDSGAARKLNASS